MASLFWPSHPWPVQATCPLHLYKYDRLCGEGISLAMLKGFLISTTASPQQEHSYSKSGDAPRYCLVLSMKIPHSLYETSLDVQTGLVIPLLLAASTLNSNAVMWIQELLSLKLKKRGWKWSWSIWKPRHSWGFKKQCPGPSFLQYMHQEFQTSCSTCSFAILVYIE